MESSKLEADWETGGDQDHAALLLAVFGDSDTDEGFSDNNCIEEEADIVSNEVRFWENVEEVEGLSHCSHFLSIQQQRSLLNAIDSEGWFSDPLHNQAMRFGELPGWAMDLSALIRSSIGDEQRDEGLEMLKSDQHSTTDGLHERWESTSLLPPQILEREPLFDQMIVNLYQPGEGISAHVDLLRFEDGIAILSLESTCVMTFRFVTNLSNGVEDTCRREAILGSHHASSLGHDDDNDPILKERSHSRSHSCEELETSGTVSQAKKHRSRSYTYEQNPCGGIVKKVDVLLNPGDLILTHGPARYSWTHEITRDKGQVWQGQSIEQQQRVSVTLRRLCVQQDGQ